MICRFWQYSAGQISGSSPVKILIFVCRMVWGEVGQRVYPAPCTQAMASTSQHCSTGTCSQCGSCCSCSRRAEVLFLERNVHRAKNFDFYKFSLFTHNIKWTSWTVSLFFICFVVIFLVFCF